MYRIKTKNKKPRRCIGQSLFIIMELNKYVFGENTSPLNFNQVMGVAENVYRILNENLLSQDYWEDELGGLNIELDSVYNYLESADFLVKLLFNCGVINRDGTLIKPDDND